MLTFKPMTDEEINMIGLLEKGIYQFEVISAKQMISQTSGKPMVKLTLSVRDRDNKDHLIYDYLIESIPYKIKHFCDSVGLQDKYKKGLLEEWDFKGKLGHAKIFIKKDKDGRYKDQNAVADYMMPEMAPASDKQATLFNDDLPPF